jgi:hypothetical protein
MKTRETLWFLSVLLLALVLRVINLGSDPYWHDEVHNLMKAEYLWGVLTGEHLVSNHPPLLTILIFGWKALGWGESEASMRMLTVLIGVGGVAATYGVTRALFGARAALLAAFLLAISPFHVHHSQDLKDYILLPLVGTVTAWALYRASEKNGIRHWFFYGFMAALACYSEIYAAPLLIGLNLWFVFQVAGRWDRVPRWILANVGGAVAFLPYFFVLWRRFDEVIIESQSTWIPAPGPMELAMYFKCIAFGYSGITPLYQVAMAIFGMACLAGALLALGRNWRVGLLIIFWFAVSVGSVYVGSQFRQSFFLYRGMLAMAVPVYILVGLALARLPGVYWRAGGAFMFAAMAALPLLEEYRDEYTRIEFPHRPGIHPARAYDKVRDHIVANWQEGDIAVVSSPALWYPIMYYGMREEPLFTAASHVEYIRAAREVGETTDIAWLQPYYPLLPQEFALGHSRVWFVYDDWEPMYLADNVTPTWYWLDARYGQVDHWSFKNLELFLFEGTDAGGEALRVVAQEEDDGAVSVMKYAGRRDGTYRKTRPDEERLESIPEAKAGDMTLRFADAAGPDAAAIDLSRSADERSLTFSLTHNGADARRVRMMIVPSDGLLDARTLLVRDPRTDVWRLGNAYNPVAPPGSHPIPAAVSHVVGDKEHVLEGAFSGLSAGDYDTLVYHYGTPGNERHINANLRIELDGHDLLSAYDPVPLDEARWRWLRTGSVTVSEGAASFNVVATASQIAGLEESYANWSYIAFRKAGDGPFPIYDEEFEMTSGEAKTWTASIDSDVARFDVWVIEYGEGGKAYRIFRELGGVNQ